MSIEVSIIIVNYNSKRYLENCISSIYLHNKSCNIEVIVVDNASVDNSLEQIDTNDKDIKIIKNSQNLGFAKAANQGAKIAQGKYIFFLNPDIYLKNNAIKILFDFMEHNKNCMVAGGLLTNENGKYTYSFGSLPKMKDSIFAAYGFYSLIKSEKVNINRIQETEQICGADFFISKDLFFEIGMFSEDFFLYYEEIELCYRLRKKYKNKTIYFVPNAVMVHHQAACFDNKEESQKYIKDGINLYYKKTLKTPFKYIPIFLLGLAKILKYNK